MVAGVYLITNKINDHKYVGGSVDIFELKKKIESKGLPWKIVNIENAIRTMQEDVIYG